MSRLATATFRSLHYRNYRLFFIGQLVSLIGTWMQSVALGWLVYTITKSPTQIGVVIAVQFLPTLLGSVHGGLVADRFDKRKVLLVTQSALAVQAAVLAVVTLSGLATLPVLYVLAFTQGMATTIDNPTRQAFVSEMVGTADLTNAVGLNSAMFNMARVLGPAIGGILIDAIGVGTCFVLNAVSFVAVIGGLLMMRSGDLFPTARAQRGKGQLREGLRYAWEEPTLRLVLIMIALIGTLAMNFTVILPVVAKQVFRGNAGTYGLMSSVLGFGALVGALVAASRSKPTTILLAASASAFGVTMLADALAPTLAFEMVALAFTGATSITFMATANATVQLTSRPEMRGRVMSLYMLLFLGSTPIGGPIVGWIGEHYGARWSLAIGAMSCLGAGVVALPTLTRNRRLRDGDLSRTAGDALSTGAGEPAAA
ncbi:MAG: MFS transporter [Acidimicrobiales bacterium]